MDKKNVRIGRCADIYADEMNQSIKTLKRFREAWLLHPGSWDADLIQFAEPDFYFYRFAIDRNERSNCQLLTAILLRVMDRYGVAFEIPEGSLSFVINDNGKRVGYRLSDFHYDEDIDSILQQYSLDEICILRSLRPERSAKWIVEENQQYEADGKRLKSMLIGEFFKECFGEEECKAFYESVEQYSIEARDIIGFRPIKFYSTMNLAAQKAFEEKYLADWQYKTYEFQIINRNDPEVQSFLYFSPNLFPVYELDSMWEKYITEGLFRAMVGMEEYAESFLTAEWLFYSLEGLKRFDYTAVISGYFKSVEQLLYIIVMLNVGNNCKITMSDAKDIGRKARQNKVKIYEWDKTSSSIVPTSNWKAKHKYIDLTSTQVQYMDSSIGTFEYFLRNNPHIFAYPGRAKSIADLVSCFRTECRNKYFHTHNCHDWDDIVKKVRSNAIFLYFVLLGGCIIPKGKYKDLGIDSNDEFDDLCKRIRAFRRFNPEFIFEYLDGKRINLIYDFKNNTAEYTDEGVEHYQSLLFYQVNEFSLRAYEELDKGISEEQKVFLRRDNLPSHIFGVYRDRTLEEILF